MSVDEIMQFNQRFVDEKRYEPYAALKYPRKRMAVLSCMDTRLTALLPAALGLQNGDAVIIKVAGAVIDSPYGSVMRSLLIAVHELGVEEILVIGHHDCGTKGLKAAALLQKAADRHIDLEPVRASGVDLNQWLDGFDQTEVSVRETVVSIRKHPLIPEDVRIYGLVMDPKTGKLDRV